MRCIAVATHCKWVDVLNEEMRHSDEVPLQYGICSGVS
jgi:hypothetical protein